MEHRNDAGSPRYHIGERIAAGGMAEIFAAQPVDRRFDRPIVLKRMFEHLAQDAVFRELFINEARLSTRLDHPNVVRVYDFEAGEAGLFLVMEYIDGPDLLAILNRCVKVKRLPPPELAVYIACHVLEALDYAHSAVGDDGRPMQIVHRDVSPSNILIDRRGNVKLADFGIARAAVRKGTTATTLKGKYAYMSPEQITGQPLDGRSDVYALAIVLAEMLTLRRLFAAPSDLEILLMARRADLSRLDRFGTHIPATLDAILRKGLTADRDQRHASAAEFRDALVDWLASCNQRTAPGRLAELISSLEREGGDLSRRGSASSGSHATPTMSGTNTRVQRDEHSQARRVARRVFALGNAGPGEIPAPASIADDLTLAPFEALRELTPAPARLPAPPPALTATVRLERGVLGPTLLVDVWSEIGRTQATGLLTLHSGDRVAETYFRDGHPQFVRSNLPAHRFGEFLVERGVLTRGQLTRAVAALPVFGGRMGQTLVGLGLIQPVDAVRLLAEQVAYKLEDCCQWSGRYEFATGRENPWPRLELHLNVFTILSQNTHSVPTETIRAWLAAVPAVMLRGPIDVPDSFAFPTHIRSSLAKLSSRWSLRDELTSLGAGRGQGELVRAGYVLWRCGILVDGRRR